ncbi:MAG: hypothetical protein K6A43_09570 [Treponema sp.]|nr:hypothetical protein [Treponema sp.]
MEEDTNFDIALQTALLAKQDWYNSTRLPELLESYRLLFTSVKKLNELFVSKSLIDADPYKFDKRISEISVPSNEPFNENELSAVMGARLSEYETMLDFICTYFRFSVENLTIPIIKSMLEINAVFAWNNLSLGNAKPNTKGLSEILNKIKTNMTNISLSVISDNSENCSKSVTKINALLSELADFQKELYKGRLRKDLFTHPDFDKEKAFSNPENELAEIKRLYPKVIGKKAFYIELINEIIEEDQSSKKEELRAALLEKLAVKTEVKKVVKKEVDPKEYLMLAVNAIGGLSPILVLLEQKLTENFDVLYAKKKTLGAIIKAMFRKMFGLKEPEKIVTVVVTNPKTAMKSQHKIKVNELMIDIDHKQKLYTSFASNGPELEKIKAAAEEAIISFVNKQISENQQLYTKIDALDEYFKSNVESSQRAKIKGMKIDLSSYKGAIINLNKKRGEYVSYKEDLEQMRKLGISNG